MIIGVYLYSLRIIYQAVPLAFVGPQAGAATAEPQQPP